MKDSKMESKVSSYREIEIKEKTSLVLTKDVERKINQLCDKISTVEWSGIIFYKVEGGISDPKNMTCTIVDIYPMHKGTGGYTEYEFGKDVLPVYEHNPELIECKYGHVH